MLDKFNSVCECTISSSAVKLVFNIKTAIKGERSEIFRGEGYDFLCFENGRVIIFMP